MSAQVPRLHTVEGKRCIFFSCYLGSFIIHAMKELKGVWNSLLWQFSDYSAVFGTAWGLCSATTAGQSTVVFSESSGKFFIKQDCHLLLNPSLKVKISSESFLNFWWVRVLKAHFNKFCFFFPSRSAFFSFTWYRASSVLNTRFNCKYQTELHFCSAVAVFQQSITGYSRANFVLLRDVIHASYAFGFFFLNTHQGSYK